MSIFAILLCTVNFALLRILTKIKCLKSSKNRQKQGLDLQPFQIFKTTRSVFYFRQGIARGGGFFHSKGTWGCAAREGILFRTSSLAKGVLFGNFSRVRSRQGYAFWEFWSKRCQNSVIFVKKPQLLKNFGLENAKIWQVLPRKCQFRALLKEKLV